MRRAGARARKFAKSRRFKLLLAALAGALAVAPPSPARADDDRDRARAAYDRGAAAHKRGDHAAAARAFAEADELAPNPVSLRVALDAAVEADDPLLGMTLVERAQSRPGDASSDPALEASLKAARERFAGKTGRVRVVCPAEVSPCSATLDGVPIRAGEPRLARIGHHALLTEARGLIEERRIDVKPDTTVDVIVRGPAAPPPSSGPSAVFFFLGLGLTVVSGGATIASGVNTKDIHDQFIGAGCSGPIHADCTAMADDGRRAQIRTNILAGVTAALGVSTAVLGVLSFGSGQGERAAVSIDLRAGGSVAKLTLPLP